MTEDPELVALSSVCSTLAGLTTESQQRIVDYVVKKFELFTSTEGATATNSVSSLASSATGIPLGEHQTYDQTDTPDDTDGISPVAIKWMQRNGLTVDQLGHIFSLGADEIDLVASSVPGTSKRERTRNVTILKGIASYLSTGVARITAEQIKEACLHYDAYDSPNHAKGLRGMSTELTGSRESGFKLTGRGLSAGAGLIRQILGVDS
ncbi:MAG: hypothetical protein KDA79_15755 [Planctomycetaceae bacterium]|nr:hypothetical protein [Planctomycetaceae bacterium]